MEVDGVVLVEVNPEKKDHSAGKLDTSPSFFLCLTRLILVCFPLALAPRKYRRSTNNHRQAAKKDLGLEAYYEKEMNEYLALQLDALNEVSHVTSLEIDDIFKSIQGVSPGFDFNKYFIDDLNPAGDNIAAKRLVYLLRQLHSNFSDLKLSNSQLDPVLTQLLTSYKRILDTQRRQENRPAFRLDQRCGQWLGGTVTPLDTLPLRCLLALQLAPHRFQPENWVGCWKEVKEARKNGPGVHQLEIYLRRVKGTVEVHQQWSNKFSLERGECFRWREEPVKQHLNSLEKDEVYSRWYVGMSVAGNVKNRADQDLAKSKSFFNKFLSCNVSDRSPNVTYWSFQIPPIAYSSVEAVGSCHFARDLECNLIGNAGLSCFNSAYGGKLGDFELAAGELKDWAVSCAAFRSMPSNYSDAEDRLYVVNLSPPSYPHWMIEGNPDRNAAENDEDYRTRITSPHGITRLLVPDQLEIANILKDRVASSFRDEAKYSGDAKLHEDATKDAISNISSFRNVDSFGRIDHLRVLSDNTRSGIEDGIEFWGNRGGGTAAAMRQTISNARWDQIGPFKDVFSLNRDHSENSLGRGLLYLARTHSELRPLVTIPTSAKVSLSQSRGARST
jgi:hypothetical protein